MCAACNSAGQRQSSGKGKPGSSKGRAGSGKSHGSSNKKVPGSKGSQASAEPPPQESFYVYESVMPPEEQRTYEELRRVLMKAPGGAKHAANLQGIWGCYQDARRNTEAMAFRGHRLLDQVCRMCGTSSALLNFSAAAQVARLHSGCDGASQHIRYRTDLYMGKALQTFVAGHSAVLLCWSICRCLLSTAASSMRLSQRLMSWSMSGTRPGRSCSWLWWQAR